MLRMPGQRQANVRSVGRRGPDSAVLTLSEIIRAALYLVAAAGQDQRCRHAPSLTAGGFWYCRADVGEDPLPFARLMAPSQTGNHAYLRWMNRLNRLSASPADFTRQVESIVGIAGTTEPARVGAPTIVVHLTGDRCVPIGNGRVLAERIPNSKLVEVEGTDHLMYSLDNWREVVDPVIEFFTDVTPPHSLQRRFAAVMFTDIVGSTTLSSSMGDHRYREVIEQHDRIAHRVTTSNRGRVVKSTGDGILAVFDSPSAAVDVASSLRSALEEIGLTIRVGIHAGEIEEHADRDISGLAVNLAARVEQAASDGSIFVSSTMKDLLLGGGGIEFENRGEHTLKGSEGLDAYEVN